MENICVNFKRYGYGYMNDSFSADGYTYAVYYKNMIVPKEYTA